jgi:hypothetical protein
MFLQFFYALRDKGVPVTPTAYLRLQKALSIGTVLSIDDFYTAARSILVKSERYFDIYDQLFAHHFRGAALAEPQDFEISEFARAMLDEWLRDPEGIAKALGVKPEKLKAMTPEELIKYFFDRLKEQTGAHRGGNRWIGTRGTSPVGHSGNHPGGMRVGGVSRNKSAIKVAMERRYKDYSQEGPLTEFQLGEALKRLRRMIPGGPRDVVNVNKTIYETIRNAGEIEIIFDKRLKDKLKVILMIDNGGWSMEPYIEMVQTLFNYASSQFKELKIYFFHNTVYTRVWSDPQRRTKQVLLEEFVRMDPESRLIIVGDASMAPYELSYAGGSIYLDEREGTPSIERLKFLAATFRHAVWINPMQREEWGYTWTVRAIEKVFPMFELTLDGLEKAVQKLMAKN